MKPAALLSPVFAAFLFWSCFQTDPGLDSRSVKQIRVDIFSHFWINLRISADSISENALYWRDDPSTPDLVEEHSVEILKPEYNKVKELPEIIEDTFRIYSPALDSILVLNALFIQLESVPKKFSCYLKVNRKFQVKEGKFDNAVFVDRYYSPLDSAFVFSSYDVVTETENTSNLDCTYYAGKGIFLPSMSGLLGEFIIEY